MADEAFVEAMLAHLGADSSLARRLAGSEQDAEDLVQETCLRALQMPETGAIVVGIGTGLSVTGIAREVRERGSSCPVFGVEPAEAAIASGRPWAPHNIPGLAPPIAQPLLEPALLAGIVTVNSEDAWRCAREAARQSGLLLGSSSGATVAAARKLREREVGGPIVSICACSINDYLETDPTGAAPAAGAAVSRSHG